MKTLRLNKLLILMFSMFIFNFIYAQTPTVDLSASVGSISEHGGTVDITATLSVDAIDANLTVHINWTNGDLVAGEGDIVIPSGSVPGTTTSITLTATDNDIVSGTSTVTAAISGYSYTGTGTPTNGSSTSASFDITDDDVELSVSSNTMDETGGSVTLTATSGFSAVGDLTVTIDYGGTATDVSDYVSVGTITISDGATSGTAVLNSVSDIVLDPSETIIATITAVSQGQIASANSETITITDDETQTDFISAPINGLTGVEIEPVITWVNQAGDNLGYNVYIATSGTSQANFEANITASNLADADILAQDVVTYQFDELNTNIPLSHNTTYYLQVVSMESANVYHYSNIYHFTTFPTVTPTLSNPADGETVYTESVLFGWTINQPVGTLSFKLQVQETTIGDLVPPTEGEWAADGSGTNAVSYTTSNLSYSVNVHGGKQYYWRVVVLDENNLVVDYSSVYDFVTSGGATVNPIPSWPIGGNTVYSNSPTLYWYLDTYAPGVTYQVRYGTDPTLTVGTNQPADVDIATATSNLYANLTGLNPGTTYYWEVRAYYAATSEFGSWSAINSFVTHGTGTLSVPVVSYPIDGVEVYTTSPYLYWYLNESGLGLTYDIEIDDNVGFASPTSLTSSFTYVQASGLVPGTTYYWRVRSDNGSSNSAWSTPVGSFIVAGGNANAYPVATYPTLTTDIVYTTLPTTYWYLEGSNLEVDGYIVKYSTTDQADWSAFTPGANSATSGSYTVVGATTTYQTFTTALSYGQTYYWAVCAVFDGVNGTTYGEGAFTVAGASTEGIPVLSSPENASIVYNDDVTMYWYLNGSTVGIDHYNIQYSESDVFAGAVTTTSTTQSVSVNDLNPGSTYYWRVQSVYSDGGTSSYSGIFHFTIDPGSSSVMPFPGSPINEVIVKSTSPVISWVLPALSESQLTYELQYSLYEDFSDFQTITVVENPFIEVTNLQDGSKYFWRVKSTATNGDVSNYSPIGVFNVDVATGVEEETIPTKFDVEQNYPNPFNPSTTIKYQLPKASNVSIIIYDVLGNEVKSLINDNVQAGYHSVIWNGTNNAGAKVSSGVYFYRVVTNSNSIVKKMLLIK